MQEKLKKNVLGHKQIQEHLNENPIAKPVFLDVGAYSGKYALRLSQKFPTAVIHCIEPDPANFKLLQKRVRENNVRTHQLAIASYEGECDLYLVYHPKCEGTSQSNSINESFARHKKSKESITVPCTTLNKFCQDIPRIDYLKFNCEGAEYEVFTDDLSSLEKVHVLCLQVHGKNKEFFTKEYQRKRESIRRSLLDLGFRQLVGLKWPTAKNHVVQIWRRTK